MRTLFVCFALLFWEALGTSADRKCVSVGGFSFGTCANECFGVLGGNGAGKSSTFEILTGNTLPNTGSASVNGRDCGRAPTRRDDWSVICALKENTNTAVVLTSQSMDEVESLVSNLIILREIVMERSPQLIKNKFGDHCNFNLVPDAATDVAEITTKVTAAFSGAILYDSASLKNIKYRIPRHHSDVFEKAASIAEQIKVTDFSFTQATLEDSFILAFTLQPVMQSPPFGQQLLGQPQHFYPRKVTDIVITCVGMHEHEHRATGRYSGGQRCKISVAASLFAQNSLIILDEPTAGIDPIARRYVWYVICELRENANTAILLTSHSMDEVEALVSNLITLSQESIVVEGSPQVFKNQFGDHYKHNVDPGSEMNVGEVTAQVLAAFPSAKINDSASLRNSKYRIPNLPIGVFFILDGFIEILINAFFGSFLVCFFDRFFRRRRTESLILIIYFPAPVHSAQPTVTTTSNSIWIALAIVAAVLALIFIVVVAYFVIRRNRTQRIITVYPRASAGGHKAQCEKERCKPMNRDMKCHGGKTRHGPCWECFQTYKLANRANVKCPKNSCPGTFSVYLLKQLSIPYLSAHLDNLVDEFDKQTLELCAAVGIPPSVNEEFAVRRPVPYGTRLPDGYSPKGPIITCYDGHILSAEYLLPFEIERHDKHHLKCPVITHNKPCDTFVLDSEYKALRVLDNRLALVP